MPFYSPLRYPGGKRKLSGFIKKVFEENGLCDGTYIEPYAGGAGVALALLLEQYAWNIVINDFDPNVYAFWWSVLNETDDFLRLVCDTTINIEEWQRQKQVLNGDGETYSLIEKGFAAFFMNRTNRSGILNGGVIGGKKQNGKYKIDVRFNKIDLVKRIELIAQCRDRIEIHNLDAMELLGIKYDAIDNKTLVYFDPPYYVKGKDLYANYYTHNDHAEIAKIVRSLACPWIVTYDNVAEIRQLYDGENCANFSLVYTAHTERQQGSEILFYNLRSFPNNIKNENVGVYWH